MNFTNELLDFAAASVNWNLITVPFLLAFLFIQYKSLWAGMWSICIKILYLYSWKAWKYMDFIFMFWLRVKIFLCFLTGITPKYRTMLLVLLLVYSLLTLFIETSVTILWSLKGESWSWNSNWFVNLFGLQRYHLWPSIYGKWCF